MRWYGRLAGFDMIVEHKPGKDNINADALSRASHLPEPPSEQAEEEEELAEEEAKFTFTDQSTPGEVNQLQAQLEERDVQRAQEQDEVLREVRGWVRVDAAPTRAELRDLHPHLLEYR